MVSAGQSPASPQHPAGRGPNGRAAAEARRKAGRASKPLADDRATEQFLKDLLCNKNIGDDVGGEAVGSVGEGRLGEGGNLKLGTPSVAKASGGRGKDVVINESSPPAKSTLEVEEEKREFIKKVCGPCTRPEVQEWVGKVFTMDSETQAAAALREAKEKRRRRLRSSSAASDSGLSGQTGVTGTTATALQTVGGSIAAPSHRPKSVESDESLVVHHTNNDEPLSMKERIQAFLDNRVPELTEHIDAHVAKMKEELKKEVDEDVAEAFLRTASNRKVFDGRANYLRWQNARHQALQKRLDAKMGKWILEGIDSWEAQTAEKQPKEVNETDLIFDYLTKRAAHIDTGKLPSQIPVFKKLTQSYSLPRMWKDRFIN